jgi:hypothetical protein
MSSMALSSPESSIEYEEACRHPRSLAEASASRPEGSRKESKYCSTRAKSSLVLSPLSETGNSTRSPEADVARGSLSEGENLCKLCRRQPARDPESERGLDRSTLSGRLLHLWLVRDERPSGPWCLSAGCDSIVQLLTLGSNYLRSPGATSLESARATYSEI